MGSLLVLKHILQTSSAVMSQLLSEKYKISYANAPHQTAYSERVGKKEISLSLAGTLPRCALASFSDIGSYRKIPFTIT